MLNQIDQLVFHNIVGQTIVAYAIAFLVPLAGPFLFIKFVGVNGLRNILSYETGDTVIHRLDPRIKLIYPLFVSLSSILLSWQWTYALFAISLVPWVLLRPTLVRVRIISVIAFTPALLLVWSQGLYAVKANEQMIFAFPTTMFWVGTAGLSKAGLIYGLQQAARLIVTFSASMILIFTTQPSEIVWATTKLLVPQKAGLALSVAIRFLPSLFERLNTVMRAAEVRGFDLSAPSKWWKFGEIFAYGRQLTRALRFLTVPVLIGSLRGCGQMALVADSRAFGVNRQRTTYRDVTWATADRVAMAAGALVAAGVVALVFLGGGRFGSL